MCVDYQKLNVLTKKDAFPIPWIHDILEYMPPRVGYFSMFDLFMGYNQVGMDEDAMTKSAFVTPMDNMNTPGCPLDLPMPLQHSNMP
jgi:hypothetical protein